jgi:hypothetical protein
MGGKHRTEVREVTGGECGRRMRLGGHSWLPGENTRNGKALHRGHGGHRGVRLVDEYDWVGTGGFRARTRESGRHRTEVTEVTEGGAWSTNTIGGHSWLPCGNTRIGKASHRGHEGHRGGSLVDQCDWVNTAASVGEYEEAPRPGTLNAAEKKYLLLISTDLIGLAHLYADSHIRQSPIANS